ncbi:hypothetical protein H311_04355, partial [Anncaliia algerae PRA109]
MFLIHKLKSLVISYFICFNILIERNT